MTTAGTAVLDITPPLGCDLRGWFETRIATAIRDPLHVRAFALESPSGACALAICDLIGVERRWFDLAKARLAQVTPLRPSQVLFAATHTHEGPETRDDSYTHWLVDRLVDAVRLAWDRREPAQVGWGSASESRVVFNRRYHMTSGPVLTNPGLGHPHAVRPAGPVDPQVGVLGLRRPDGRLLGVLGNYALHYIGVPGEAYSISADYFGEFAQALPALLGEPCLAALSNGCCGDINNLDVLGNVHPRNERGQHTRRVAGVVAAAAQWALAEADWHDDPLVGGALVEVPLTPKPPATADDHARAESLVARGSLTMDERVFVARTRRDPVLFPEPAPVGPTGAWVQVLRLGELAVVGLPGEVFCELGLAIKARSPFAQTMVLELANDSLGYLPTRAAYAEGGYEPASSDWAPGAGEELVEAAVKLLEALRRSPTDA